jgi:hypothetical protein
VEAFVAHLADWAEKDRNGLLCQLNSYPINLRQVQHEALFQVAAPDGRVGHPLGSGWDLPGPGGSGSVSIAQAEILLQDALRRHDTGSCSGGSGACTFDWGLPFFFGRQVYTNQDKCSSPDSCTPLNASWLAY